MFKSKPRSHRLSAKGRGIKSKSAVMLIVLNAIMIQLCKPDGSVDGDSAYVTQARGFDSHSRRSVTRIWPIFCFCYEKSLQLAYCVHSMKVL